MFLARRTLLIGWMPLAATKAQNPPTAILECTNEFSTTDLETGEGLHCFNFRFSAASFPVRTATLVLHFPELTPPSLRIVPLLAVPKPGTWRRGSIFTVSVKPAGEGWSSVELPAALVKTLRGSDSLGLAIVMPPRKSMGTSSISVSGKLSPWPPFLTLEGSSELRKPGSK